MRVIKNRYQETEITCPHCNSDLAYTPSDVWTNIVSIHGDWYDRKFVTCPVCSHNVVISYKLSYPGGIPRVK